MSRPSLQMIARSGSESRFPQLWRGLVGAWAPCLGPTGATLRDWSGRANHGTLTSMDPGTDWVLSGGNRALDVDATDDLIDCGSGQSLDDLPQLTASAWIYPRSAGGGGFGRIIDKSAGLGPTDGWILNCDNGGAGDRVTFNSDSGAVVMYRASDDGALVFNRLQFIAVTWDGGVAASGVHIYVVSNGSVVEVTYSDFANGTSRDSDATASLKLGNSATANRGFDGLIVETLVHNRILGLSELARLATRPGIIYEMRERRRVAVQATAKNWHYYQMMRAG